MRQVLMSPLPFRSQGSSGLEKINVFPGEAIIELYHLKESNISLFSVEIETDNYSQTLSEEFNRLSFNPDQWMITGSNADFSLCETYPKYHIVLKPFENQLQSMANFRRRQRFPSVVFRHQKSGAVILRCSQPMVGEGINRCMGEEDYLRKICSLNQNKENSLMIFDARPASDVARIAKYGGGSENNENYNMTKHEFLEIPNLFFIRAYFERLIENLDSGDWHLETLEWIQSVSMVIYHSQRIANYVAEGSSALIHCTDGWDRTPQLTALTKLFVDPFYRSLKGFAILIQQEWCEFGHRFGSRCAIWPYKVTNEYSPIFLQWLDCIFQIMRQVPDEFQFNAQYLQVLATHISSGIFGNFYGDSVKERLEKGKKIMNIWSYLSGDEIGHLHNTDFQPSEAVLKVDHSVENLDIWRTLYISQ